MGGKTFNNMVLKLKELYTDLKYNLLRPTFFLLFKIQPQFDSLFMCAVERQNICLYEMNRSVMIILVQLEIHLEAPCVPSEVSVVTLKL